MSQSNVQRRFVAKAVICAAAYLALVYGARLAIRHWTLRGLTLDALAVTPIIPIVVLYFLFARYLRDIDEYRRHRTVQALLIALAVSLSILSGWDFLQAYGGARAPEAFILTSGFILLFALVDLSLKAIDKFDARKCKEQNHAAVRER